MIEQNSREPSRHYNQIWTKVIQQVFEVVLDECDTEFKEQCHLEVKAQKAHRKAVEEEYRCLRKNLKELCYGKKADEGLLDGRKMAAIFCNALIKEKTCVFDLHAAHNLLKEKKSKLEPNELNLWAVNNIFINYKFAYYVSLQLVYLTLLRELLSEDNTKQYAIKLNNYGHLYQYPRVNGIDSFDVNVIIGLAQSDIYGKDFDMFLFAMQLYQIEQYTIEKLKQEFEGM